VREELMERCVEQTDGMPHTDCVDVFVDPVLFRRETCGPHTAAASPASASLRLNTHGCRRYALRAYAPLRLAMCSTDARSVRIR
jgi:hypothetical protein